MIYYYIAPGIINTSLSSQDLGAIHRAFHGYGFKMQVWPHDIKIRKYMVGIIYRNIKKEIPYY